MANGVTGSRLPVARATDVVQEVEAFERLDLEGLRAAWRERYGPPPRLRSVELLRLILA